METIHELKFEYKFVTRYEILEKMVEQNLLKHKTNYSDVLNELGKDGWELVSVLQYSENSTYIFKRAKWEKKAQGQEECKADNSNKVEPKFKVGDFIVNDYCGGKVVEITNDAYLLDTEQGIPFSYEHNAHLWIIDDARDGDILTGKIDGDSYILIFKQVKDGWVETYGHYYDSVDRFCVPSQLFCRDYQGTFIPANKEQRDLLFKKIHEAGYMWDSDSKQLLSLKAEPNNEKKLAWSEEDEELLKCSLYNLREIEQRFGAAYGKVGKCMDWLQSLKERVNWKPSDKQIRALRWILNNISYNTYKEEISGLLDQIKDL